MPVRHTYRHTHTRTRGDIQQNIQPHTQTQTYQHTQNRYTSPTQPIQNTEDDTGWVKRAHTANDGAVKFGHGCGQNF